MPQTLTEQNRARLDGIVQKMVANGEHDDAINFVVADFKQKYALPDKPAATEDFLPAPKSGAEKAWAVAKGLGRALNPVPVLEAASDLQRAATMGDMEASARTAQRLKGIVGAQGGEFKTAAERADQGRYSEAAAHGLAGLLPVLGPAAAQAGEKFETDPYGAAGESIGVLASAEAPRLLPPTLRATRAVGRGTASAAKAVGPTALLTAAEHVPVIGKPIRILRMIGRMLPEQASAPSNAGGRLVKSPAGGGVEPAIADALAELRQPERPQSVELPPQRELPPGYEPRTSAPLPRQAQPPTPSPNAGGRLAPKQTPSLQQELADALAEVAKPEQPRLVTTPPQAQLPAGFTPRSTVPKPKPARAIAPEPAASPEAPAAPKRAYFLRPLSEMKASEGLPVERLGRPVTIEDLPASWRSRTEQLSSGGKAGAELGAEALAELQQRGLSVPDALDAVAKNPALSPSQRLNLQSALVAMLGGG